MRGAVACLLLVFGFAPSLAQSQADDVLVPYSRTLFFIDKGRERGVTAELARDFERMLNEKRLGKRPLTIYLIPTTRDKLLSGLVEGRGDIAAGNLTVTPKRLEQVDFVAPENLRSVDEVIATGPKSPELRTLDDLAGKTVHVRSSTSYRESLDALNERFAREGKPKVKLADLPNALEDEDKLEMLNAGLLEIVVIDDWKGRMWAQVLPQIRVREDLVLRAAGRTGWAIRKHSPQLAAELAALYANAKKLGTIDDRFAKYHKEIEQISNNTGTAEWKRFETTIALFDRYGQKYRFDPLMLAAQGYQESRLRQDAKSHVGAISVMQIAGHRPGAGRRRHPHARAERPRRREVHGSADDPVLPGRQVLRYEPHALRLRELQRRSGQHLEDAEARGGARARSGQVVQPRRGGDGGADRARDDDVRAQHLQVLHRVPAHAGGARGARGREGRPRDERLRARLSAVFPDRE
jgi:ABC-type amino acid transport substrate-binding protein